jgi:hypothetical protein
MVGVATLLAEMDAIAKYPAGHTASDDVCMIIANYHAHYCREQ